MLSYLQDCQEHKPLVSAHIPDNIALAGSQDRPEDAWENVYPTLLPQWDRTPRAGVRTNPLTNSTPEKFQKTIEEAITLLKNKQPEHQILFLKSWNEWGEGNYVEPDLRFGHGYLQAIRQAIESSKK